MRRAGLAATVPARGSRTSACSPCPTGALHDEAVPIFTIRMSFLCHSFASRSGAATALADAAGLSGRDERRHGRGRSGRTSMNLSNAVYIPTSNRILERWWPPVCFLFFLLRPVDPRGTGRFLGLPPVSVVFAKARPERVRLLPALLVSTILCIYIERLPKDQTIAPRRSRFEFQFYGLRNPSAATQLRGDGRRAGSKTTIA